jgi:hypothetical protein
VAIVPRVFVNQSEIASAIQRVAFALAPDVVQIRYSLGGDWTGDPSIYFRIVLSDDASRPTRLREITQRVERTILGEIDTDELGLNPYFKYRSLSEHAALKDPAWA